jgi:hypothetical protein
MIKYVYVLVSNEDDYYLGQALISITSLKMRMPNAFVSLLIDDSTEKALIGKRRNILELVNELKVVAIAPQFNKKARSRWLKTSMRQHIEGDFLYIDCDTVICEDLSDVENIPGDMCAVLDRHLLISNSPKKEYFHDNDKELGFNASWKSNKHFNSGVILCKNISVCHSFFNKWHSLWVEGYTKMVIDQPSFNQVNYNLNNVIKEMEGVWNCQIHTGGIAFLADAKIIHYFSSIKSKISYTLFDPSILQNINLSCVIDEQLKKCLLYPKRNFYLHTEILTDKKTIEILYSKSFKLLRFFYDWKCFQLFEKLLRFLLSVKKKFKAIIKAKYCY